MLVIVYAVPYSFSCSIRSTFQTTIDELQSALGDLKTFCDTCVEKEGESFMTANVYCLECKMKYCNRHHKVSAGFCAKVLYKLLLPP